MKLSKRARNNLKSNSNEYHSGSSGTTKKTLEYKQKKIEFEVEKTKI
jgi:hypothetical protein